MTTELFAACEETIRALLESMQMEAEAPKPAEQAKGPKYSRAVAARIEKALSALEEAEKAPEPKPKPKPEQEPEPADPPKGWTWRGRVAKMTEPPKRYDYPTKRDWNLALSMYKYYNKPGEPARINSGREVRRLLKRAEDLNNGLIVPKRRGRPPKVHTTDSPESV